ncbi:MAG: DNA-directed RNA polymerase subunit L [Candidatus Bathyarchaeota archaeon]|nr:DNA-directed RNA polymerase subunit L [Candidatus Bathyarchaeota archaeon]
MRVRILKKLRNELKMEVEGEGHTFCNVIQRALLKDRRVDLAGYSVPHPLTSSPVIYVRTRGQSKPATVLKDAIAEVQKESEVFRTALEKALKTAS